MKIVLGKSHGKDIALDLDILLRTRLLIEANSGGGKSYLLRRIAEQLFGKIQVILIDPEGEFATLREKFGYVLVGKGGETPADPRSAELLAQKLLEIRASAVCDLYEMKAVERHRWVRIFLESLIDAPKKLWHPVIVIVDESHNYCPEKGAGESEASDAMIGLATRGRKRGFSPIFATQRLGKLRKDAAAELLNVLIGQTFIDIDRKRAAECLGVPNSDQKKFFDAIKVLEPGQFYALGRAISLERTLIGVGPIQTTHPEPGSSKYSAEPPPPPEKVKMLLPKLADLPKAAEERARTVAEFQREIRDLKMQLRIKEREKPQATKADYGAVEKEVQRRVALEVRKTREAVGRARVGLERTTGRLADIPRRLLSEIQGVTEQAGKYIVMLSQMAEVNAKIEMKRLPPAQIERSREAVARLRKKMVTPSDNGGERISLRAGAMRMLEVLVQWHPQGMREGQMRAHAGLRKSGTFSTYMSDLRRGGYIEERDGIIYATEIGIEMLGKNPDAPTSTEEVLAIWGPKLRKGAKRMLEVLVRYHGELITREQLAEEANISHTSGTFGTYLSDLRTARLVRSEDDMVMADKETLFLDSL